MENPKLNKRLTSYNPDKKQKGKTSSKISSEQKWINKQKLPLIVQNYFLKALKRSTINEWMFVQEWIIK